MSDSNLSTLGFIPETTWGTTPATPAFTKMRITGESLSHNKETVESDEIRDDRQIADLVEVGSSAQGAVNFELSYEAFQGFFEAAFFNDLVVIDETVTASITAATDLITGSAGDFDDIPVGASVRISGSAESSNNGIALVVAKASDGSTITLHAGALGADTTSESLTLTGEHLSNGTTRKSFSIERRILNSAAAEKFQIYRGMMVDSLNLNFESKRIVTGSLSFMGKLGADNGDTSADSDGTYSDAPAGDVVNATSHVGTFLIDRAATTERFKSLSLSITNNLRGKDAMSEAGNFDVGVGAFQVTGTINAYFQDESFHEKFINHSDVAVSFQITDPDGNTIVVTIPRMKLSTGTPAIEGKNTDVMISSGFTAIKDDTTGITLAIDFHDAP